MDLLATVSAAWGWTGLRPDTIVGENDFGNLLIRDIEGRYWRLCPEELYCRIVADSREQLDKLSVDQDFLRDWHATALVEAARSELGPLRPGFKYYLVKPAPLGGAYTPDNMRQISLRELVSLSGEIARQIDGLPDGSTVGIEISS